MILRWLETTSLPVEASVLLPEALAGRPATEVAGLTLRVGNQDARVGDVFSVYPSDDETLTLEGDLRNVRGVGRGMTRGAIVVRGRSGSHLGAGMTGGRVDALGDAGDWAGAGMSGGVLNIAGRAGRFLGASEPGHRVGMRDGLILVHGDAGEGAGRKMRRGLIAVAGRLGDAAGQGMIAGSVFAFGGLGRHAGLGMKRGTIAAFGDEPPEVLPSFASAGVYRFPFLAVYLAQMRAWGFPVPPEVFSAGMARYNGDLVEGGRGELLVRAGESSGRG